jgi:hypothetical protein
MNLSLLEEQDFDDNSLVQVRGLSNQDDLDGGDIAAYS